MWMSKCVNIFIKVKVVHVKRKFSCQRNQKQKGKIYTRLVSTTADNLTCKTLIVKNCHYNYENVDLLQWTIFWPANEGIISDNCARIRSVLIIGMLRNSTAIK